MAANPACKTFIPQLSPYIDGELTPDQRTTIERHLSACKDCTMRVADLRAESGLVRVGMEMLADEVDFKDFAQKVMARVTPERPPLFERVRLSLSEMFLYQKPMMVASLATACAAIIAVSLFLTRQTAPAGFAGDRMAVETVKVDEGAHVAPVVMETDNGDVIVFTVDHDDVSVNGAGNGSVNKKTDSERDEELGIDPSVPSSEKPKTDEKKPNGGEL